MVIDSNLHSQVIYISIMLHCRAEDFRPDAVKIQHVLRLVAADENEAVMLASGRHLPTSVYNQKLINSILPRSF